MKNYKGFLIIQPAFIGDVILATAVVESLADKFPGEPIDFFVRKGNETLLANNPHIRNLYVWDKKKNKYRNLFSLIGQIRNNKYKAVINIHRFFTSGLVTALAHSKIKSGYKSNPLSFFYTHKAVFEMREGLHETMRNYKLINFLGTQYKKPVLYPSDADFEAVKQYTAKPFVTIAPASVWFTKQFPAEKWIELIDGVLPKNIQVYLLGGKQDVELCEKIKDHSRTKMRISILAGKLNLLQSAALMKNAVMNYVNDSAPLHLCSAVNAPVRAVFCSTVPAFGFYPLSDNAKVIEVKNKLACRPCGIHGKKTCPEGHFKCAYGIDVKEMAI
jgi:heptosyltransferase-2